MQESLSELISLHTPLWQFCHHAVGGLPLESCLCTLLTLLQAMRLNWLSVLASQNLLPAGNWRTYNRTSDLTRSGLQQNLLEIPWLNLGNLQLLKARAEQLKALLLAVQIMTLEQACSHVDLAICLQLTAKPSLPLPRP